MTEEKMRNTLEEASRGVNKEIRMGGGQKKAGNKIAGNGRRAGTGKRPGGLVTPGQGVVGVGRGWGPG